MQPILKIDNRTISTPLFDIIKDIQRNIHNNKLRSIRQQGSNNIRVTCPFHKNGLESRPSADVYVGENTDEVSTGQFKCFTCGKKVPFYSFVAECFDQSDEWAKDWLIENYSDGIIEQNLDLPEITLVNIKQESLSESILEGFEDFHPYMLERKLTKEVCSEFEVKYDPKSRCLVFPVRDETGKLWMLTRRSVDTKQFIIDKDKQKPVYLLYYLKQHNITEAFVCESQINTLSVWTHHLPAIGLFGTGSDHQYELLNKSNIRVYNLLFDGDEAGDKGIEKFLKNIRKDVIVNIIKVPRGKDVNDLTYDEFEKLINSLYNK